MPQSTLDHASDAAGRDPRLLEAAGKALDRTSLHMSLRDHAGSFVAFDARSAQRNGIAPSDVIGRPVRDGNRPIDRNGRELSILEHPAQIVRISGTARVGELFGIRRPDGDEHWYVGDFIPLDHGPEGHAVLAVLHDVTELQGARVEAEARAGALEWALALASCVAGRRLSPFEAVVLLREPLERLLPGCALALSDAGQIEARMYTIADRSGMAPFAPLTRVGPETRARREHGTHVNNELKPTDIYGTRVIGTDAIPARSSCIVPLRLDDGPIRGVLVAYSQLAHYFTDAHITALEAAAPILAAAIDFQTGAAAA